MIPEIALENVVVVPMIPSRSLGLLVIAAGKDQNGISTAVNAILPVRTYKSPAKTQRPVVPRKLGFRKLNAISKQNSGPARSTHGRKRPHLLLVRSAMTPIEISVNASKILAPARSAPRKAAGSARISVINGVAHVAHKV